MIIFVRSGICRVPKNIVGSVERSKETADAHARFHEQAPVSIIPFPDLIMSVYTPPWKYTKSTMLSGLLHVPGSSRSQAFAVGLQDTASFTMSIKVYMTIKMFMPCKRNCRARPAAVPSRRRSRRLIEILERPLPINIGILKAKFHFRTSICCCGDKWLACCPKP